MSSAKKSLILSLYKQMLREGDKFAMYNYRMYAVRKIRDTFRQNKNLSDFEKIENEIKMAEKNLDILKRQVLINKLYFADKLIIEEKGNL